MEAAIKPRAMAEDSDEEDLEALRLAALQSIKSKPAVVAPRRRPKPIGRPNRLRNFYRGCVNTNLISIVPMENPLDQSEPPAVKLDEPPPLVLPQHRYCKTEVKSQPAEKETQVSTKFSRYEDSNSGDSDDDLEDDMDEKSSDSDRQCETAEKTDKVDPFDVDADDDELLLQDEDSLGKFFNEIEEEMEGKEKIKSSSANATSQPSEPRKPSENIVSVRVKDSNSGDRGKDKKGDGSSFKRGVDNKTSLLGKRVHESLESVNNKEENFGLRNNSNEGSPIKKALTASEEDGKRINRPCVLGRNRSPSPVRSKQDYPEKSSPIPSRKRNSSPLKRKASPPSPESLSPYNKRETQLLRLSQVKTSHPPRSLPSRNSPKDMTPPSYWGSRSNSNHGYSHALMSREWSSSPHKRSGHPVPGSLSDPPRRSGSKNISPLPPSRASKSPPHRSSRVRRSSDRDWSTSPPRRRYRDFDTPPDSFRSVNDGGKVSRRKSSSPMRLGERSRQVDKLPEVPYPRRYSPVRKGSRSPKRVRRSRSPVRSPSRTPSLSPSPDREGKSSTGNYRRHKSPLRLPNYRPPGLRDGRSFRPDGKVNRMDSDRRVMRPNGPIRKTFESKLEVSKARSLSSKTESKSCEPTPEEKLESTAKNTVVQRSPTDVLPMSNWSSDEGEESDSESRFKGTDAKGLQPTVTPPALSRVRDLEEITPPDEKSPKKKKNKRTKKNLSKSTEKDDSPEELKAKRANDVDLRAELSRRRAERVIKAKATNQSVPVRLVQSALQSLTSKSSSIDGERSTFKSYTSKADVGPELLISKKKPIHMRLGLPVARNPDPPELPSMTGNLLPRISAVEQTDGSDPSSEGGNKWRKVKLKRNVTVQKSLPRGTTTNASGKEQV
ncbi:serine/arginine repetitive matrix protein 5-like [Hetaerina americana]|uniref:serine/arginine repetitive matrix protein 5-like n=1 Tax=Hetaerina americana TaxID=62018 RepID=UPI003A7F231E